MELAVGRLQFSVTVATPRPHEFEAEMEAHDDPVETAYRRERTHRQIEADRERWADSASARGPWAR
jgi:hypothetical protein